MDKDWQDRSNFDDSLRDLDLTSSPGYPYMKESSTIGKWLGADGLGNFDQAQVERLWFDVQRVMAGQYDHWFRAFIKDEPHKVAKAKQSRWRLIIASSLPVQMVWRMLFRKQNDLLNKMPYEIPSKHGTVFCYGGWRRFVAHMNTHGLDYARDISAWDVNAPGWALKLVGEWRCRWPGVTSSWIRMQKLLYADAFDNAKIVFSNGRVVQQQFSGFMKSGVFNTIADNSIAMVAMHVLACMRTGTSFGSLAVTGDDVLQSNYNDQYGESLEQLGCRIKEVMAKREFMGTDWSSGKPQPLYFQKHLYNVAMKGPVLEEVLDAYCRLYCLAPQYEFWEQLASELQVKVRSRSYYEFWYSSPLARVMNALW